MDRQRAELLAAVDQDKAGCVDWWKDQGMAGKLAVAEAISWLQDCPNPVLKIAGKFAGLKVSEMVLEYGE